MPCVELHVLPLTLALALGGRDAPPLHESGLESGLRLIVAASNDAASGATAAAAEKVEALFVTSVGWANDASTRGSGLAALAADYATFAPEGEATWRAELLPTRTLFSGSFALDALEPALATLVKRLTADGVDEERWKLVVQARKPAPLTVGDRFRETAWPTTRFGARPAGAADLTASLTRDGLKQFLTRRCGCEGALLVLVGSSPPASLELTAARALGGFPRARGVAPVDESEPFAARARRVAAPDGTSGGLVGFRLAWHADERGDGLALARAFLEAAALQPAAWSQQTPIGGAVAFAAADEAAAAALREVLLAKATALARGEALGPQEFTAALDRLDAALAEAVATPAGLARLLAEGALRCDDPRAAFGRRQRLEGDGAAAAAAALAAWIVPSGWIEVLPRSAPGTPAGS